MLEKTKYNERHDAFKQHKRSLTTLTISMFPEMHPKDKGVLPSKSLQFTSRPKRSAVSSNRRKAISLFVLHASCSGFTTSFSSCRAVLSHRVRRQASSAFPPLLIN